MMKNVRSDDLGSIRQREDMYKKYQPRKYHRHIAIKLLANFARWFENQNAGEATASRTAGKRVDASIKIEKSVKNASRAEA
jgi:hypothetical protein